MFSEGSLFVLVGQCGNQVGRELTQVSGSSKISVDSEAKVVLASVSQSGGSSSSSANAQNRKNIIYEQSGRGSNWALGYTSGQFVMEQVRRRKQDFSVKARRESEDFNALNSKNSLDVDNSSDENEDESLARELGIDTWMITDDQREERREERSKQKQIEKKKKDRQELEKIYGRRGRMNRMTGRKNGNSHDAVNDDVVMCDSSGSSSSEAHAGGATIGTASNDDTRQQDIVQTLNPIGSKTIGFVDVDCGDAGGFGAGSFGAGTFGSGFAADFGTGERFSGLDSIYNTNKKTPIQPSKNKNPASMNTLSRLKTKRSIISSSKDSLTTSTMNVCDPGRPTTAETAAETAQIPDSAHSEPYLVHAVKKKVYEKVKETYSPGYPRSMPDDRADRNSKNNSSPNFVDKLIVCHSVGGGTGSGLGSRLIEELSCLKDMELNLQSFEDYRSSGVGLKLPVVSCAVMPIYSVSETCLQAYNACFSLSWMQEFCSGCVIFENEKLLLSAGSSDGLSGASNNGFNLCGSIGDDIVNNSHSSSTGHSSSSSNAYGVANRYIARTLDTLDWNDFLCYTVPMPSHRFAQVFSYNIGGKCGGTFNSAGKWQQYHASGAKNGSTRFQPLINGGEYEHKKFLKKLTMSMAAPMSMTQGPMSTHAVNSNANTTPLRLIQASATIFNPDLSVIKKEWLPPGVDWNKNFCLETKRGNSEHLNAFSSDSQKNTKTVFPEVNLALNWTRTADIVQNFLTKAKKKFSGRAFVHWYNHYGIEDDDFHAVFEKCNDIVENYSVNVM